MFDSRSPRIEAILDHVPCAVALWNKGGIKGSFNCHARELLGVTDTQLCHTAWINQVDPRDRDRFASSWDRLKSHSKTVRNDYRFLRSDGKSIWLRDVSAPYQNLAREPEAIISTYTDISDLKLRSSSKARPWNKETLEQLIGPVIHEVRNNLHAIRLEIDLLLMDFGAPLKSERFLESMDRVNRALYDLREYVVCPEPQPCAVNPKLVLDDLLYQIEQELEQRQIKVEFNQATVLPLAWIDAKQFRSALERVIDFCRVLLDKGGKIEIDIHPRRLDGTEYVELTLTTSPVSLLELKPKDIFRPFLKVNNRQLGLGMALARQILLRNRGDVSFVKESPRRGRISILLKADVQ
jgi:PAS domain S-box-containing protein